MPASAAHWLTGFEATLEAARARCHGGALCARFLAGSTVSPLLFASRENCEQAL